MVLDFKKTLVAGCKTTKINDQSKHLAVNIKDLQVLQLFSRLTQHVVWLSHLILLCLGICLSEVFGQNWQLLQMSLLIWKYTTQTDFKIWTLLENKDNLLFKKITTMKNNPPQDLLPLKWTRIPRKRGHDFQLSQIRTEIYKNLFMNRCLNF